MDKTREKNMSQEETNVPTERQLGQGRSGCSEVEEEVGSTATECGNWGRRRKTHEGSRMKKFSLRNRVFPVFFLTEPSNNNLKHGFQCSVSKNVSDDDWD